eukprot:3762778-Rhodomonas_salina.2
MSDTPPTACKLSEGSPLKPSRLVMAGEAKTPPPFPDFAKHNDVHCQYTVADLKIMLTDACLAVMGDKKALVSRVC